MTDRTYHTIAPAMSARDWQAERWGTRCYFTSDETATPDEHGMTPSRRYNAKDHFRDIALHNNELPDGDPRKFTSFDVDTLRGTATYMERELDWDDDHPLRRLAERIEALLPHPNAAGDYIADPADVQHRVFRMRWPCFGRLTRIAANEQKATNSIVTVSGVAR
jgi:hypothetical protein